MKKTRLKEIRAGKFVLLRNQEEQTAKGKEKAKGKEHKKKKKKKKKRDSKKSKGKKKIQKITIGKAVRLQVLRAGEPKECSKHKKALGWNIM